MIRAVIFDFDGVILQSADIKTQAFAELFCKDFPAHANEILEYHRQNMGISRFVKFRTIYEKILKLPLSSEEEARLGERFKNFVYEKMLAAPLVPGALEFIQNYSNRYDFFIASGTPVEELREIAEKRNIARYFKEMHGSPAVKEEIIRGVLSRHGWTCEEVVFIGDAESDRRAAESTRVRFIGCVGQGQAGFKDCELIVGDLMNLEKVLSHLQEVRNV